MTLAWVWWAAPDPAAVHHPLLDHAERHRCASLRQEKDRARHATGRILAKRAVAQWCQTTPEAVAVVPDREPTKGRPRAVVRRPAGPVPWISITHAGEAVGVAVCAKPCGLDVQDIDSIEPLVGSDLVFSGSELRELAGLTGDELNRTACCWWVAKESALKAVGLGLSVPLSHVPGEGDRVTLTLSDQERRLRRGVVSAPEGHVSALAVETEQNLVIQVGHQPSLR